MKYHKPARWILVIAGFVLILVQSACLFNPGKWIGGLFASATPTETATPTYTPTPTNSPTPTSRPLPPLQFYGCAFSSDCPDVPSLQSYYGDTLPTETLTYIQIQYDQPVRIGISWATLDQEHLDENMPHIKFFFKLDGVEYDDALAFNYGVLYDDQGNPTTNPGYFGGVVLSGWEVGIPHKVEYGLIIDSPINDGWDDYQPQTISYQFMIMPLNLPTATPTITPWPTKTPIPYTPRPTKVPATATAACESMSTLDISNTTGGQVTLYLRGPASYTFYLQTGDTTLDICAGDYSYTAYGCGGASDTGSMSSGESHEFYCSSY